MLTGVCQRWNDKGDLSQSVGVVEHLLLPVEYRTSRVPRWSCLLYGDRAKYETLHTYLV